MSYKQYFVVLRVCMYVCVCVRACVCVCVCIQMYIVGVEKGFQSGEGVDRQDREAGEG